MNGLLLLALACLSVPALACMGNGCGGSYNFRECKQPVCYSGQYVGYGCMRGVCPYVCFGSCQGFGQGGHGGNNGMQYAMRSYNAPMQPPRSGGFAMMARGTGYNAKNVGYTAGCLGGNCGYFGGCMRGRCGGYYDFRSCMAPHCMSGPYQGHRCVNGFCALVCFQNNCQNMRNVMPNMMMQQGCYGPSCGYPMNNHRMLIGGASNNEDEEDEDNEEEDEEPKDEKKKA